MHPASTLPIAAQVAGLRTHFPDGVTLWRRNSLSWRGLLSPSRVGRRYDVEMRYSLGSFPQVWVRKPDLHSLSGGRRLPHVYDQKEQRLCLFVPDGDFWRASRALAITAIPWACHWLYYFELWLVTDEWAGAGKHPVPPPEERKIVRQSTAILF